MGRLWMVCVGVGLSVEVVQALSLDQIHIWSGAGTNRAVLLIEWPAPYQGGSGCVCLREEAPRSLAWGFRWNGRATMAELIVTTITNDARLFGVLDASRTNRPAWLGLGLDANENSRWGLRIGDGVIAQDRFIGRFIWLEASAAESGLSLDFADWYAANGGAGAWRAWRERGKNGGWVNAPVEADWEPVMSEWESSELGDGSWVALCWRRTGDGSPPRPARVAPGFASAFAYRVLASGGSFGPAPYEDPLAVLGEPARWFYDPWAWMAGRTPFRRVSVVEPPFYRSQDAGTNLLVTLAPGGWIVVEFDPPLTNDPAHPYGLDFLVFGNAFFVCDGPVGDNTDFMQMRTSGAVFGEPLRVSVSPGYTGAAGEQADDPATWRWYRYDNGPFADTAYPTQGYLWDRIRKTWSEEPADFTLPVHPGLLGQLQGAAATVADVMRWYGLSGGGTGFDLTPSGFDRVRFVRIEGLSSNHAWGEVDAVVRVRPVQWGDELLALPQDARSGDLLWFQPAKLEARAFCAGIRFHELSAPVWVRVVPEEIGLAPGDYPACLRAAFRVDILPASEIAVSNLMAEMLISGLVGGSESIEQWEVWADFGLGWRRLGIELLPDGPFLRMPGLTGAAKLLVVEKWRPSLRLVRRGTGMLLAFEAIPGWRHVLERTLDWRNWSVVATWMPDQVMSVEWVDAWPIAEAAFYRLRLERP
ncbi:MAG: hypothetical protein RMN51_03700 [Verrucomicrobiota bacterium]|nr:hypothetical protein [Limisphaera sp.]MDW8381204.1 hypothetical protein [Verrucomicrobiota bacterium]